MLAWFLLRWFLPDRSLMLNPSGCCTLLSRVLEGLEKEDDISPKAVSLPYDPAGFWEMARSFALWRASNHSSADDRDSDP